MVRSQQPDIASAYYIFYHYLSRPLNVAEIFGREAPLEIEIGFGLGDYLIRRAQGLAAKNFIGIDVEPMCVYRTLHKLSTINQSLEGRGAVKNIRLLHMPAEVALERLFHQKSVDRMYSLFPCPWPKKRHVKHRTFSKDFLRLVNSRLKRGGALMVVTDWWPYCEWIKDQAPRTGFAIEIRRINAKYQTKYERKWRAGGQKRFYEILFSKVKHISVPVKEDAVVRNYIVPQFDPRQFCFKDITGPTAIILKDFIFDARKKKGMVHLVVQEKSLVQYVWVMIAPHAKGFKISLANGNAVLPTEAVARAVSDVARAARRIIRKRECAKKKK